MPIMLIRFSVLPVRASRPNAPTRASGKLSMTTSGKSKLSNSNAISTYISNTLSPSAWKICRNASF